MDQHPFPRLDLRLVNQRIPGSEEGHRDRRRRFEGHTVGQGGEHIGIGRGVAGETLPPETGHRVAGLHGGDVGADGDHPPGALEAEDGAGQAIIQHVIVEQAGRQHDVAEIEARGRDRHLHFVGTGRSAGHIDPIEIGEHALGPQFDAGCRNLNFGRPAVEPRPQPDRRNAMGVDQEFALGGFAGDQIGKEPGGDIVVRQRRRCPPA